MSKFVVSLISVAFALVIGFACGALLTAPENSKLEQLINEKKIFQKDISDLNSQCETLRQSISQLEQKNHQLRDDLLNVYQNMEKVNNKVNNDSNSYKNDEGSTYPK
jgi:peptidoglycan hydrolase CwlO-like protein